MRVPGLATWLAAAVLTAGLAAPARAELRVSDLDVFLNDHEVTVHVVLLGAIPGAFQEGLESGIPAHVRLTVELWQYQWLLPDRLLASQVVERSLAYNIVSKEFKVVSLRGETRPPYLTRDLRDAQRVLSEARGIKMMATAAVEAAAVIYARVHAQAALGGEHTLLSRMAGTAEQATRQSAYRTIDRVR